MTARIFNKNAASFFLTAVFFLFHAVEISAALPTAEDINSLSDSAKQTALTFMNQSFNIRISYEFNGVFLSDKNKTSLCIMARRAGDMLTDILDKQRKFQLQIEQYQGQDWDSRYGETGLWRKLEADLYFTIINKSRIDLYYCLCLDEPRKTEALTELLQRISTFDSIRNRPELPFVKAMALAQLSQTDPNYAPRAKQELSALESRGDIPKRTALEVKLARIKFFGHNPTEEPDKFAETMTLESLANDFELILSLTMARLRYDPASIEKTVYILPQTEDLFGSLILEKLQNISMHEQLTELNLRWLSVFDAELAAKTAWKTGAEAYRNILVQLSGISKAQTPLVMYVTAAALAKNSPEEAVGFLIKAGRAQHTRKSETLGIEAEVIARQAAQIGYNIFADDPNRCRTGIDAYNNYYEISAGNTDEELEYLYAGMFNRCGMNAKGKDMLESIARRPANPWHNPAKLDLIRKDIQKQQLTTAEISEKLEMLIKDCQEREQQLRTEAITIYCQMHLAKQEAASAGKVVNMLAEYQAAENRQLNILRAKAHEQLNRLEEAAEPLLKAVDPNDCSFSDDGMVFLLTLADEIDQVIEEAKYPRNFLITCDKIIDNIYACSRSESRYYLGLIKAEIGIFKAAGDPDKLSAVEQSLDKMQKDKASDDVNMLRCRARLLKESGRFAEAAELWAKIGELLKFNQPGIDRRNGQWWRAKYYELFCLSRSNKAKPEDILHTVEVLENTCPDIPVFWAQKLGLLKNDNKQPSSRAKNLPE